MDVKYVSLDELREMMQPSSGLLWSPWFKIIAEKFLPYWWAVSIRYTILLSRNYNHLKENELYVKRILKKLWPHRNSLTRRRFTDSIRRLSTLVAEVTRESGSVEQLLHMKAVSTMSDRNRELTGKLKFINIPHLGRSSASMKCLLLCGSSLLPKCRTNLIKRQTTIPYFATFSLEKLADLSLLLFASYPRVYAKKF